MEKPSGKSRWKPIMLVQIYRLVRIGIPDIDICRSLKVSRETFYKWQRLYPELKEAVEIAKRELAESENFPTWVYSRLSPSLQALWDKIEQLHGCADGVAKIEMLLQDNGKKVRQQLFLFALCISRFSPSVAMQKVNITKKELDRWMHSDVEFAELVDEVQWHKGNFFEESLVALVQEGNPAAVMFANRTFNRERGYEKKSTLSVEHSGNVMVGVLDLAELIPMLTESTKLELLGAIRKKEAEKNPRLTVQDRIRETIAVTAEVV